MYLLYWYKSTETDAAPKQPGGLEKAVALWEEQGVVVFPALLGRSLLAALLLNSQFFQVNTNTPLI